jgi:predicted RND superfamily exporter protein
MRVPVDHHQHSGAPLRVMKGLLAGSGETAIRHSGKILAISLMLCVFGVIGACKVQSNTDLLGFLGEESRLVQDTRYIDEHLTGTGVIELLLDRADGEPFAFPADFDRVAAFTSKVRELDHVKHALGIVDLMADGLGFRGEGPVSQHPSLISADARTLRITVSAESVGTREGARLIGEILKIAREPAGEPYLVTVTGPFYRIIAESNQLTDSQLKSFGVALLTILLSIGIVFRSLRFLVLSILPNVAPLLVVAAIMGFGGIDLSVGTSMIASVMIGIAVDDTIHFLAAFRRQCRGDVDETIRTVLGTTGVSLFATTLALSLGFWVAIFGSFQPTVHFALLSGITMWLALAFDLLVLPACLKFSAGRPRLSQS